MNPFEDGYMSVTKALILGVVLFSASILWIHSEAIAANSVLPEGLDPASLDQEHVIIQACLPDKVVAFENVELDLTGSPPVRTLLQERAYNAHRNEALKDDHNVAPLSPDQGDRAIIRKWVVGSGPSDVSAQMLGITEVEDSQHEGVSFHSPSIGFSPLFALFGNTVENQPVYEEEWDVRQNEATAIGVRVLANQAERNNYTDFWFKPPKIIPHDGFSDWQNAISQESAADRADQTEMKLMQGEEITIHPVEPNAPRVRFRIMSARDYYDSYRFWYREQGAITNKYFVNISEEVRNKLHFVPVRTDTIPSCSNPQK